MNKPILCITLLLVLLPFQSNASWQMVEGCLHSDFALQVDPMNPLPDYPRPQMTRTRWKNLNGLWQYAITQQGEIPETWEGDILVPFCVESALSGVGRMLTDSQQLWYQRTITIPREWHKERMLLHFGAVDWYAQVYVNQQKVGEHKGGYVPFTIDITDYVDKKGDNLLQVAVIDPTTKGYQAVGKQRIVPKGIWYTPVTGIWQTVWLEPVGKNHIMAVVPESDIDQGVLNVQVQSAATSNVRVRVRAEGEKVAEATGKSGQEVALKINNIHLWTPEDPYLYDLEVELLEGGKVIDQVKSYAAMRKISMARDEHGFLRMQLNNQNLFHYGLLDQGWWPDGLYTAPSDEALVFDIIKTKSWGFNMIRKHVKVEPARWYYYCDKMGVLVWQDMPSGDSGNKWNYKCFGCGTDRARTEESKANYYHEWGEIMDYLKPHPCIVMWVPFNEAWGQFDTEAVAEWTQRYDPTRLVNAASGGNFRYCGDVLDLHNYPEPKLFLKDSSRVCVMGEYGGIGLPIEGHLWGSNRNWGYIEMKNTDDVTRAYQNYARMYTDSLIDKGCSGAVYTQTTDVEGEVNGLMTYDRKVVKINEDSVRAINQAVITYLK